MLGRRRGISSAVVALLLGLALSVVAGAQAPVASLQAASATGPTVNVAADPLELGLPWLRSFSPKEYGAGTQNWAIAQDPRGVVYVGNDAGGVLEFDGQRWRLIRVANSPLVRSLAVDAQGRVHVGAVGEFGTLEADASGKMRYVSWLDRVPVQARDFADVWNTFVTPQGVVFSSYQRLMRLDGDRFESWTPAKAFQYTFRVGERLFIRDSGRGLLELVDGQLQLLPGGERFADEMIFAMLPGGSSASASILIGTRTQGFFVFDGDGFAAWPIAVDAEIKRDLLYRATRLPDGRLALGTLRGGLYFVDGQGRSVGHLSKDNGLLNESIYSLLPDREGGLWIGTDNGLTRAEVGSPLSRFDERSGLAGVVLAVHRHQGQLYVATAQGLFRLLPGADARFQSIPGFDGQTWAFLSVGDELLVADALGVHAVVGDQARLIHAFDQAESLHASQAQPGRVFVGGRAGLATLRRVDGRWLSEGPVPGIDDNIFSLQEDRDGWLWLGTFGTGVVRVRFPAPGPASTAAAPPQIERFGVADGLPTLNNNWVCAIGGEPRFTTQAGVYRFNEGSHRFEPDPRFERLFDRKWAAQRLDEAAEGIWLSAFDPTGTWVATGLARRQPDGGYRWEAQPLSALAGAPIYATHLDPDGVVWFGGPEGLYRYDPRVAKTYSQPFPALLRRVSGRDGQPIFDGSGDAPAARLAHTHNALRFDYAAPSFDGLDALRFQVRLDGSDSDWSDWNAENYRDYNNLFEGDYQFRVRARNLYDTVSSEAVYAFTVLPPWYRTLWAYLAYVLMLAGSGWAALRWRLRLLRAQKRALEATVAERTADILKLGEIGKELTATLDIEQAFERVYRQIGSRLDAHAFWIGICRPERSSIHVQYLIEGGTRQPGYDIALTETHHPAVWCVRERRELVTATAAELLNYVQGTWPAQAGGKVESMVCLPLIAEDRVIACLSVQSRQRDAYAPAQLEFLRVLASYAAIALDKASAHQALERRRDELAQRSDELARSRDELARSLVEVEQINRQVSMLGELTGFLQACSTAAEAVARIGEYGPRIFSGSRGALYLRDAATQAWIRHGGWGESADVDAERFGDADCWALLRGRAYRFDAASDAACCPHLHRGDGQIPIHVCLPLTAQDQTFGLLHIGHAELLDADAEERRYGMAVALAEQIALAIANVQLREALLQQSIRDPLTGLYNRRYLQEAMPRELARATREHTPLALLMIDVDHFKRCNDRFGHPAGDHVLKHVARALEHSLRAGQLACRFGGEEFALLLPGCGQDGATAVAERILAGMRGLALSHEGRALDPVTVSIGIALCPQHGADPEKLIEAADGALYAAKQAGRDRLVISQR